MSLALAAIIGAIISAVAGIAASGISAASAKRQQERQNEMNIQNWEMQQDYNSPINQMARFEAAGLNRNLAIGNAGNASTPLQTGVPDYSEAIQSFFGSIGNSATYLGNQAFQAQQNELNRDIQRGNQEINRMKVDNEREKIKIQRSLADLSLRKGDLQMAAMFLSNSFDAATFADRVRKAQWESALYGERAFQATQESIYAPEFYALRNNNLSSMISYRRAAAAQGWRNLSLREKALNQDEYQFNRKFYWSKEMDKQRNEQIWTRITILRQQLEVAKTAEQRKQIEQELHYLFEALNTYYKFENSGPVPIRQETYDGDGVLQKYQLTY